MLSPASLQREDIVCENNEHSVIPFIKVLDIFGLKKKDKAAEKSQVLEIEDITWPRGSTNFI